MKVSLTWLISVAFVSTCYGCPFALLGDGGMDFKCTTEDGTPTDTTDLDNADLGTTCFVSCLAVQSGMTWRRCTESHIWEGPHLSCDEDRIAKELKKKRQKRFWRRRSPPPPPPPPPNGAPTINGCPTVPPPTHADKLRTDRVVTWKSPTAYDPEQGAIGITRTCGQAPGSLFAEGTHTICYRATDNKGLSATCTFSFTVSVRTCPVPSSSSTLITCSPSKVLRTPGWRIMWGTVCQFSCAIGLRRVGLSSVSCLDTEKLSGASPTCRDSDPPQFTNCPSSMTTFCKRSVRSATLSWPVVTATDSNQRATVAIRSTGPTNGATVVPGNYNIRYTANDGNGNEAVCSFSVHVKVIQCTTPSAVHVVFDCTTSDLIYGTECDMTCEDGYIGTGSSVIQCEMRNPITELGTWANNGQFACSKVTCERPDSPAAGDVTCPEGRLEWGLQCQFSCNPGYTLHGDGSLTCSQDGTFNSQQPTCTDVTKPKFVSCGQPVIVYADRNMKQAVVSWQPPTAADTAGTTDVRQSIGPSSGSKISEGVTQIEYTATDGAGNTAVPCRFTVTVIVVRCADPEGDHVEFNCTTDDYILGTECRMGCDAGYTGTGTIITTCEERNPTTADGTWRDMGQFSCSKITCNRPDHPTNGAVKCPDGPMVWDLQCQFSCDTGYTLHGDRRLTCTQDGTFSNLQPTCSDITSPEFTTCPQQIIVYAERHTRHAHVSWSLPEAHDSVGTPTISQSEGPDPGSYIKEGETVIEYIVVDAAGNAAAIPCRFTVSVLVITCATPMLQDIHLELDCTGSAYVLGTSCNVTCNSGMALEGSGVMVCERGLSVTTAGRWDMSNAGEPHCNPCPAIIPPTNGAIACSADKAVCQIQCGAQFDSDRQYSDMHLILLICTSSRWLNIQRSYTCENRESWHRRRLPEEQFYFHGNCKNDLAQEEIMENMKNTIEKSLFSGLVDERVVVTCP